MFDLTESPIDAAALRARLLGNENCGAFNCFEGWVRRQNEGSRVDYLVYSVYRELALNAGKEVIAEAKRRFAIADAVCVHRHGRLEVGEMGGCGRRTPRRRLRRLPLHHRHRQSPSADLERRVLHRPKPKRVVGQPRIARRTVMAGKYSGPTQKSTALLRLAVLLILSAACCLVSFHVGSL